MPVTSLTINHQALAASSCGSSLRYLDLRGLAAAFPYGDGTPGAGEVQPRGNHGETTGKMWENHGKNVG